MRHRIAGNRLSRNSTLRKATVRDLAKATLIRQRICTTKAKAKEARKLVDQLITLGKGGTLADRRRAFAILCDHKLVSDLFKKTSPRFKDRIGGYTRIITLGTRRGDNANLAFLELTEKEKIIVSPPKAKKKSAKGLGKTPTAVAAEDAQVVEKSETGAKAAEIAKDHAKKPEFNPKPQLKDKGKDQVKPGRFLGGLRKIFQRKSPGGK